MLSHENDGGGISISGGGISYSSAVEPSTDIRFIALAAASVASTVTSKIKKRC